MYGSSLTAPTVSDAQGGTYALLQNGNNGSVYLWIFRRTGLLAASSTAFTVTVVPSSGTAPIEVMSIEVLNDGGADATSTFHLGSGTSETSSVTSTVTNDLVLFLGADTLATFSSWGSGQTGITPYPSPPSNVSAWGSHQPQAAPGSAASTRTVTASTTWVAVSIAISPLVPWSGIAGKAFVTVSPVGLASSPAAPIANNGADYGPDTPATLTSGIQEALDSIASGIS
jgi:hypothetical protein